MARQSKQTDKAVPVLKGAAGKSDAATKAVEKAEEPQQPYDQSFAFTAAHNVGKDLLQLVLQELRALPKPWPQLVEHEQNAVIERARIRIESSVTDAVKLIMTEGKVCVVADLVGITIANTIQAKLNVASSNETDAKHALFEAKGQPCLIILADAKQFTGGIHEIKGEKDQRALELNTEYQEKEDMDSHDDKKPRKRSVAALPYSRQIQNRRDAGISHGKDSN